MFKLILQFIIIAILLVDVFCILCAKFFIKSQNKEKYEIKQTLKKTYLILYITFGVSAILLLLISLF